MGKLIGSKHSNNFAENLFITKAAEYLDDNTIIYWNRQLFGREFDVCLLMPEKGLLVVELKGWREENILRIENSDTIVIRTNNGEKAESPQKQARGYRFSLERHIKQNINKFPLVFQMVCLPQVSHSFFKSHRLDIVIEEKFAFLKEDLSDNLAFFNKLDQALREVRTWERDSFDKRTMLEVRNLFETGIDLDTVNMVGERSEVASYHAYDYSRFYYVAEGDIDFSNEHSEIVEQYLRGCKLYCVFADAKQLQSLVLEIDTALSSRGLARKKDDLHINLNQEGRHYPEPSETMVAFNAFHCSFSVATIPEGRPLGSFCIHNGDLKEGDESKIKLLGEYSQFNPEQFLVEHAFPEKNIVIRAGAGTGKTHTMISRIGYISYTQNIPIQRMADRIVMITFTNESADQMKEKLKAYFRNCYLLTFRSDYLAMISRIDNMQISTIHSYAKQLISKLGTSFGYGVDLGITSSDYYRRRKISDLLDNYVKGKELEFGKEYARSLGMPIYAIRENILDFLKKLHNKSVDIEDINASDFGLLADDQSGVGLHELLSSVIPAVEREYFKELQADNRIHLNSMMSLLNKFLSLPDSRNRIMALKEDHGAQQFMFVDEFQDTDDSQIESLLTVAKLMDYKLFLVGDIKQCIYRFRGAQEAAFDQLNINDNPDQWLSFSLQRNYRTDKFLLKIFEKSFSAWGSDPVNRLVYKGENDRLIGTKEFNAKYSQNPEKYFRKISIDNKDSRILALIKEIKRNQSRIEYEVKNGSMLSQKEKSIAILVRENWQAEYIRSECKKEGIIVQTNTGGDLYCSSPALDMMTLVNALVHYDEAEYLYSLLASNFFNVEMPKSNLYSMRSKIRLNGWRTKSDEHEQTNELIKFMNLQLANTSEKENKWEYIVSSLRTKPVLQALRNIYSILEPWKNYDSNPWNQHYYQLNVDLLFEQLINALNVDRLTINTLMEHLYSSILSKASVDSRVPPSTNMENAIQCLTVHKSKGLEYGHVIMPFCSFPIDHIRKSQLHVSAKKQGLRYQIGYRMSLDNNGKTIQNSYYNEVVEKDEKIREETRILYVGMTRAIRSFSWIDIKNRRNELSWQELIQAEGQDAL